MTNTDSHNPLVTAVMIFLNGEKYIGEAIESIVAQTYENWELILVDDGSTDGATAIAKSFCARLPGKIRYAEHAGHANMGMSASRNLGVRLGTGSYVSFLDADDIWLPGRLERFVEAAGAFPEAGMIFGPTLYWYSWAEARGEPPPVEGQDDFPSWNCFPTDVILESPTVLRAFLVSRGGALPGICSLLVRRDAFEAIGGFERDFRGMYEDQVFLSKITLSYPVVVIEEMLDHYRQHSESCCWLSRQEGEGVTFEDLHPMRGVYLRWLKAYVKKTGIDDPVINTQVRRQLRTFDLPLYVPVVLRFRKFVRSLKPAYHRYLPQPLRSVFGNTRRRLGKYFPILVQDE